MAPLMTLDGVTHFYGQHRALGPVSIEIPRTSVGLLGPNGAGKSTLMRIALGLLEPSEGDVRVLGDQPGPALHRRLGYVPEGQAAFPDRTGVESTAYAGRLVGMIKPEALQRAHQVLDYVGLDDERYRAVETYSSGMRQRLKLAQALVHDPELLVLDEPTEGVDAEGRIQLLELLAELRDAHDLDLLVSTHLLPDVERLAEEVVLLEDGQVAASGPIEELRGVDADAFLVSFVTGQDAFTDHLDEQGVPWETAGRHLRVQAERADRILAWAREAQAVVRVLEPEERGLGDVLFGRTGDGDQPASPDGSRRVGIQGGGSRA